MSFARTGWTAVAAGLVGIGCSSGDGGASPKALPFPSFETTTTTEPVQLSEGTCGILQEFNDALRTQEGIDAAREAMEARGPAVRGEHAQAWRVILFLSVHDTSPASDAAYEANDLLLTACRDFLPEPPDIEVDVNPEYRDLFDE
jgi:hypothetical protein